NRQGDNQHGDGGPDEHATTPVVQGNVVAEVKQLGGHFITAPRRTAMSRNGAPMKAVTIPTMSSWGRMMTRARMSAATRASAPPMMAAGSRQRKSSPNIARMM